MAAASARGGSPPRSFNTGSDVRLPLSTSGRAAAVAAFLALAGAPPASTQATATIRGTVLVPHELVADRRPTVGALGAPATPDTHEPHRSVVYLEVAPRGAFEARRPEGRAVMDQRNETFVPGVLAVRVGTRVDFPNSDSTYHSVFSLSKTQPFDLGRYAVGRSKSVRFDRPGIVRVFCDIHSHMSAFILVFAHQYFAVTDEEGRFEIDDVPPGPYVVTVWNETLPRQSRQVSIPEAGGPIEVNFTLREP
jgi:plastocyanin